MRIICLSRDVCEVSVSELNETPRRFELRVVCPSVVCLPECLTPVCTVQAYVGV